MENDSGMSKERLRCNAQTMEIKAYILTKDEKRTEDGSLPSCRKGRA